MRGDRLGVNSQHVYILTETSMELIREQVTRLQPRVLVIDSIQTVFTADLASAPGSVSQVRESTAHLMALAKTLDVPVLIIGHVTKEGTIAGPRVLEHMVDTVLYFEGERHHAYRILRAVKNRFGPTNEIGMFEMRQTGFVEVENPSELLLAERPQQASGSVVVASMEGTRPLLVELQALGSPSGLGMPRRVANGVITSGWRFYWRSWKNVWVCRYRAMMCMSTSWVVCILRSRRLTSASWWRWCRVCGMWFLTRTWWFWVK